MDQSISYQLGAFVRRRPYVPLLLVVALLVAFSIRDKAEVEAVQVKAKATVALAQQKVETACTTQQDDIVAQAKKLLASKEIESAYDLLFPCRFALENSPHKAFYLQTLGQWERFKTAKQARLDREEKARKKREGVSIGMSAQDVIDSSWGKPSKVNRTTNQWGVREQWVYASGSYLYFKDGVLTSIQN